MEYPGKELISKYLKDGLRKGYLSTSVFTSDY